MNLDLVRLEYTGINTGAIPFRGISGTVYRASATTYKYVDALPEDVPGLLSSGKFLKVEREESNIDKTVSIVDEPQTAGNIDKTVSAEAENELENDIDLSTIASVKDSLKNPVSLIVLQKAFDDEQTNKKRSTVLDLLNDAIENHPDNVSNL